MLIAASASVRLESLMLGLEVDECAGRRDVNWYMTCEAGTIVGLRQTSLLFATPLAKMKWSHLSWALTLPSAFAQHIVSNPSSACEAIASSFTSPHVTVNFAQYVTAGTNLSLPFEGAVATCGEPYQVVPVDLCRVAMLVKTSNISQITLEAWLPTNWTGRFMSTGNGGLGGCIQYTDVAYGTSFGFATVGANNGHNGTRGTAFYQNDQIVADFAYRSLHTGVVVGKSLTNEYYDCDYTKSYYLGCSTGGREGFKEVQDFPDDFDGVVVGAPALSFNNLSSWSGSFCKLF